MRTCRTYKLVWKIGNVPLERVRAWVSVCARVTTCVTACACLCAFVLMCACMSKCVCVCVSVTICVCVCVHERVSDTTSRMEQKSKHTNGTSFNRGP